MSPLGLLITDVRVSCRNSFLDRPSESRSSDVRGVFLCHARLGSADPEGAHENANARPEGREVSVPTSENAAACGCHGVVSSSLVPLARARESRR